MNNGSTETMLLKEPPKTCGNCGKCVAVVGHCDDSNDRVDLYDQSCENWTPRTDDLEPTCDACPERLPEDGCKVKAHCCDLQERCQQLEQVAKKLYRRCWKEAARKSTALSTFMRHAYADDDMRPYREQLEDLGVSVDDD